MFLRNYNNFFLINNSLKTKFIKTLIYNLHCDLLHNLHIQYDMLKLKLWKYFVVVTSVVIYSRTIINYY